MTFRALLQQAGSRRNERRVFVAAVCSAAFWFVGKNIDVYRWPVVGALFEMLWLPAVLTVFLLPPVAGFLWLKQGAVLSSLHLYSALMGTVAFCGLFVFH